jgi:uncharacterized protein DUF5977
MACRPSDNKGGCRPILNDDGLYSHPCEPVEGGTKTVGTPQYALDVENPPGPTIYRNSAQTFTAECLPSQLGDPVTVTIPRHSYLSLISQADADAKALNAAIEAAESELVCIFQNTEQTFTAECPPGFTGTPVTKTVPAGTYFSTESQEDADAKALHAAMLQAEAELVCAAEPWETTQGPFWLTTGGDPWTLTP